MSLNHAEWREFERERERERESGGSLKGHVKFLISAQSFLYSRLKVSTHDFRMSTLEKL